MNLLKRAGLVYQAFKKANKKKVFGNIKRVYKSSGLRGIKDAVFHEMGKKKNRAMLSSAGDSIGWDPVLLKERAGVNIFQNQQNEKTREEIIRDIAQMDFRPKFSIIAPLKGTGILPESFYQCVTGQIYPGWEVIFVCTGDCKKEQRENAEQLSKKDTRIHLKYFKNYSEALKGINTLLDGVLGEFIALVDPNDRITADALYWAAREINRHIDLDFIYSDECAGKSEPEKFFFKPDWSPTLLLSYMYTGNLTIYRTKAVKFAGGFCSDFYFCNDYDLALRISESTNNIYHIERVLYVKSEQRKTAKRTIDHWNRSALLRWYGRQGLRPDLQHGNRLPVRIKMDDSPLVSIVIPTDSLDNLKFCIAKIEKISSYRNIEYVPVVNSSVAGEIESNLKTQSSLNIVRYDKPFNFSDKCNQGARAAHGEVLIFFNDDAYPVTADWIESLLDILFLPGVGGVSPAMFYEGTKSIQFAGTVILHPSLGLNGPAYHLREFDDIYGSEINQKTARDESGISGACMAIRKEVFLNLEGFDAENTPNAHSDIDFSFRLMELGLRCVYTPNSQIVHPGNGTWTEKWKKEKVDVYCIKHYKEFIERDRYFTDYMKTYEFGRDALKNKIFYPDDFVAVKEYKGDILLIAHEMSRTGAPIVLFEMAKQLNREGFFVMVASPSDGPLRKDFTEAGIIVYIEESIWIAHSLSEETERKFPGFWHFDSFICNFDLVVVNSMVCHAIVNRYNGTTVPIIWWLHEGDISLDAMKGFLPSRLEDNIRAECAGKYIQKMLEKFNISYKTNILLFGINDIAPELKDPETEKLRFLLVGSYERRKGQDVFIAAIEEMPESYREKSEFMFIGSKIVEQEIYDKVIEFCRRHKNAIAMKMISREELYRIYSSTLCVVAPSRDDPMPVVITEAWMFSKVCICSDKTGASYYIDDGENGFIFKNEGYKELSKKMMYIIDNRNKLQNVKIQGRKIYEEHFTMDAFNMNLRKMIGLYFPDAIDDEKAE